MGGSGMFHAFLTSTPDRGEWSAVRRKDFEVNQT